MAKLVPPPNGVTVRMYRQGHGDCFLIACPRDGGGDPVYLVIDCGYKPGSPEVIHNRPLSIDETIDSIVEATGGALDLVVLTHEHQDHLNGIWKKKEPYFKVFTIAEAWLAWTENPDDDLANELRERHHDQLLGLIAARNRLKLAGGASAVETVDNLLAFELGGTQERMNAGEMLAAADPEKSVNKQGIKLVKDKAAENRGVLYLNPGDGPVMVPGTNIRTFVLGPPRDEELLKDEDPHGSEGFPGDASGLTFAAAVGAGAAPQSAPFAGRYSESFRSAFSDPTAFYVKRYGNAPAGPNEDNDKIQVPDNAAWRRIDDEWLFSAEELALQLNKGINNTSLVLAFELPKSKKVLFFAADAQRGNWISWKDLEWQDGTHKVTTRDLLARTVLYKVGHHGSHNATLAGKVDDSHPNLSWMATGTAAAAEFTAMITAVNKWALAVKPKPWRHPLPSIKAALTKKTQGRVFQTDTDKPPKPTGVPTAAWNKFLDRCVFTDLYFEYPVLDT
jgi:beta-lactamase superfamily II metal-dependent hydrolase